MIKSLENVLEQFGESMNKEDRSNLKQLFRTLKREHFSCFAQTKRGGCKALKRKYDCLECNFYKPIRDQELDQERVIKRLKSLDKAQRLRIAEKYKVEGILC